MAELEEQEVPRNSVFHPDNIGPVTLLTLLQIKDYLAVIAAHLNEPQTDGLEKLHESGQFLCPPPGSGPAPKEAPDTDWVETEEIKKDFSR